MNPKISVIMPVYNGQKYILNSIESVLLQSFQDFELVIVNDHSIDGTLKLLENNYKNNYKVRIYDNIGKGVSCARNYGIAQSRGRYIMFLDSDDIIKRNCLQVCIDNAEKYNADIVKFNFDKLLKDKIIKNKFIFNEKITILNKDDFCKKIYPIFLESYYLNTVWGQLVKKESLKDIEFDDDLIMGEDLKFNITLYSKVNKTLYINENLIIYRYNSNSTTKTLKIEIVKKRIYDVCKAYFSLYGIANDNKFLDELLLDKFIKKYTFEIIDNFKYLLLFKNINSKNFHRDLLENENVKTILKFENKNLSDYRRFKFLCLINLYKFKLKNIVKKIMWR